MLTPAQQISPPSPVTLPSAIEPVQVEAVDEIEELDPYDMRDVNDQTGWR